MERQKASSSGLWRRHFFHVDPGHWMVARGRVSTRVASTHTLTDPESHPNSALAEFLTDSFDVTWAMWIPYKSVIIPHNKYTINDWGSWALCTIEGEVPPTAAPVAVIDAEIAIPENTQGCFVGCFLKNTFLWRNWKPLFYCLIMICSVLLVSIIFRGSSFLHDVMAAMLLFQANLVEFANTPRKVGGKALYWFLLAKRRK